MEVVDKVEESDGSLEGMDADDSKLLLRRSRSKTRSTSMINFI